jgi:hypothetical protein
MGSDFLNGAAKTQEIIARVGKWDSTRLKSFCTQRKQQSEGVAYRMEKCVWQLFIPHVITIQNVQRTQNIKP